MLLPREEIDESLEDSSDPRAELVRQLLEYKRFKDAANLLGDSADRRKERFTRPDLIIAGLKEVDEPELDIDQVSIWTLLEAFDNIMQATGRYANYDHIKDDTPIDLYQIEILHRVQTDGAMTFERIFQGRDNRMVLMGLFLAMLELIRDRLLWVEQPDSLGPIYLRALTEKPAEQAVRDAIYSGADLEDDADSGPVKEQSSESTATSESDDPSRPPIPIQELPAETQHQGGLAEDTATEVQKDGYDGADLGE